MKNSSIGYHTIYAYKKLSTAERSLLYDDFDRFRVETGEIKIFEPNFNVPNNADAFTVKLFDSAPKFYRISYLRKDKGLRWDMRKRNFSPGFISKPPGYLDRSPEDKPCSIKAKINPKDLSGIGGLAAATADDLRDVADIFNNEAERISPILGRLDEYAYSRIDYCFNGDVQELWLGCTPEQMMELIKQADIAQFEEWEEYDKKAHRMKAKNDSFRLICNSLKINCYCKGEQLSKQYPDNPYLEEARNVIRFEVQCCYSKVYAMSRTVKESTGCSESALLFELLSDERCADIIRYYFHKTIGKGNYYTLDGAAAMVREQGFRCDKERRLIDALRQVSESRGIPKAKAKLQPGELNTFKHSLWELHELGVNPVTIPKRWAIQWRKNQWGINYIPNLLNAYYEELSNGNTPLTRELKRQLARYRLETTDFAPRF
jgi:hypothetical protein